MTLQKIIDLVRHEDVVLWLGSGFSLYAGFPTGLKLAKALYDSLSSEEKESIGSNLSLMDLAEQFVRLKGGSRVALNQILRKEFTKRPGSLKWHEMLSKIPHIKTIITTNYDQLIEQAYSEGISTIIAQSDLAYLGAKTELFKVHGDILHPNSMIITRTDYTDIFMKDIPNNLIWSNIKARLSNKSLVFVGYDLEDENVKVILRRIDQALGTDRKEIFLIAPAFRQFKVQYLADFKIQYVDSKGEIFLEKLLQSLKENIVTDFSRKWVSAETFRKFCHLHHLSIQLESKNDGFDLKGITALSASFGHQISLTLKDELLAKSVSDLATGKRFGEVTVNSNDTETLRFLVNELNILNADDTYQFVLSSTPFKQGKVSVVFDDKSEFDPIEYQIFKSESLFEIRAQYFGFQYTFQIDPSELKTSDRPGMNFSFEIPPKFSDVNQAQSSLSLALKLGKSMGFTIYPEGQTTGHKFRMSEQGFPIEAIESNLLFFDSLKTIEHAYNIRFQNVVEYSKEDFENALRAATFANGANYFQD